MMQTIFSVIFVSSYFHFFNIFIILNIFNIFNIFNILNKYIHIFNMPINAWEISSMFFLEIYKLVMKWDVNTLLNEAIYLHLIISAYLHLIISAYIHIFISSYFHIFWTYGVGVRKISSCLHIFISSTSYIYILYKYIFIS